MLCVASVPTGCSNQGTDDPGKSLSLSLCLQAASLGFAAGVML